jgi:carboxyl-terminal processing protease
VQRFVLPLALFAFVATAIALEPLRAQSTLTLEQRRQVVRTMDEAVRESFAHMQALGSARYDSLLAVLRREADATEDRMALSRAAERFVAGLGNGHTNFYDRWRDSLIAQRLWLTLLPTNEGWLVRSSEIDSLRTGDIVRTIDGTPMEDFYAAQRPYIAASGERARRYGLAFEDHLWPQQFTLGLADGRQVHVERGVPSDSIVNLRRRGQELLPHRWLVPDSVAYLRIRRFSPAVHEDSAVALLTTVYAKAPAIIIDVRGNGGGNTPRRLIGALMGDQSWRRMELEESRLMVDRFRFLASLGDRPPSKRFRGAVIILTDIGCASACDDFVAPFADNHRALVVGDTSMGTTGQPRMVDLGFGMQMRISQRRFRLANGQPFEGVGVAPDMVVPITAAALRAGRDEVLDRAVRQARTQLNGPARR